MKPLHSDIFQAYAEIAKKEGLISIGEDETKIDEKKSLEWDAYDVFPKKKTMLEEAHPETVVVAPAMDAMNGVVENLQECQNIMTYIAYKTPRVIQTRSIYVKAHEDLINETIKLGFYLDSVKEPQLASLADACSEQLVKEAYVPLIIAGVALLALLGGGALYSNKNPEPQGLKQDCERTLSEIKDAVSDYPQLDPLLTPIVTNISNLSGMVESFIQKMDSLSAIMNNAANAPTSDEKLKRMDAAATSIFKSNQDKQVKDLAAKIKDYSVAVLQNISDAKDALNSARQKYETSEYGWQTYVKDMWYGLVDSDTTDAVKMLDVLARSITSFDSFMKKELSKLESLRSKVDSQINTPPTSQEAEHPFEAPKDQKDLPKTKLPSWA